jgi:hypothetical protein
MRNSENAATVLTYFIHIYFLFIFSKTIIAASDGEHILPLPPQNSSRAPETYV